MVTVKNLSGWRTSRSIVITKQNNVSQLSHVSIIGEQRGSSTYTIVYEQLNKCKNTFLLSIMEVQLKAKLRKRGIERV